VLCHVSSTGTKSCNRGCGRCSHELSERAHAPSPYLNINHEPMDTNKYVVVEPCKWCWRCPVGLQGKIGAVVLGHGKPIHSFRCRSHSKACTPCFHTSRTSFNHPEFCYEMYIVCAMMACYVLESSTCGSSGQIFIMPWACSS
jgi:hypothetical protein